MHLEPAPTHPRAVHVRSERCTHSSNKESTCTLCIDGCPTQAIRTEGGVVVLDEEACVQCEFCILVCPTAVFDGPHETAALLKSMVAVLPRRSIVLTCGYNNLDKSEATFDSIVQTRSCLAGLGSAAYVGLAGLGVERVRVQLDRCGGCPLGSLRPHIEARCTDAQALAKIVVEIGEASADATDLENPLPVSVPVARPVIRTYWPRVSRRDFLRRLIPAEPATQDLLPPESLADKEPPRERRFLLHLLAKLPEDRAGPGVYFPQMVAKGSCTACGLCATVCPTGAIDLQKELTATPEHFALTFDPQSCTGCQLCVELCPPQILHFDGKLNFDNATTPSALQDGDLNRCTRCRSHFAGPGALCPTCAFRRKNPMGTLPRPYPSLPA